MSPTGTRKPSPARRWMSAAPLIAVALLVVVGALISVARGGDDEPPAGGSEAGQQGEQINDPTYGMAHDLSVAMAAPWPKVQKDEGRYRSAVGGGTRYGDALLSYALLQHGLKEDNDRLVESAMKGLSFAVPRLGTHSRASIFEALGIVGAYRLLLEEMPDDARFKRLRPRMEEYLQGFALVRLPATTYYGNHWLIEAVLVQELHSTDLRSDDEHAVLGGERRRAARLSEQLINERIPAMAREKGVRVGDDRTFVLSDPPDDPLAYQGLSLGFYARAVRLLGDRAEPAARRTLREIANASLWLTAPDGDLAYVGRNQEQVWALGATAYGAEVAAGAVGVERGARGPLPRARRPRARADPRRPRDQPLGRQHRAERPLGPPAAEKGLDGGAGGPSFGGLTQLFVDWSLPEIADAAHEPTRIASDRPMGALISRGDSRFAVVRTKNVWYAVKATRGGKHPEELREDFGLMALKIRGENGDWRDVVRLRPITRGEGDPTDSAGPVLLRDGGLKAFPFTERARVERDGSVVISGGLRGVAEPVQADCRAAGQRHDRAGARLLARNAHPPGHDLPLHPHPLRRADRVPGAGGRPDRVLDLPGGGEEPPRVSARGVSDANARWSFNRPAE